MKISMDLALITTETIAMNKLAATPTTTIRAVMFFCALQITMGMSRRRIRRTAMRNRVARVNAELVQMYTLGSLETLWNGS
ncbi:hypothetical protein FOPE_10928 [Fonsecaea pedrosoi]|nr:hypothetical protein FOPE_10928 [Fonsecaea pedrosoi]